MQCLAPFPETERSWLCRASLWPVSVRPWAKHPVPFSVCAMAVLVRAAELALSLGLALVSYRSPRAIGGQLEHSNQITRYCRYLHRKLLSVVSLIVVRSMLWPTALCLHEWVTEGFLPDVGGRIFRNGRSSLKEETSWDKLRNFPVFKEWKISLKSSEIFLFF